MDFCDIHISIICSRKGQGYYREPKYINPEIIVLMDMTPLKMKCVDILLPMVTLMELNKEDLRRLTEIWSLGNEAKHSQNHW